MTDLQDADRLLYSAKNMFNNDAFKILFRAIFSLKIFFCTKCGSIEAWKQGRAIPIHPWFFSAFLCSILVLLQAK